MHLALVLLHLSLQPAAAQQYPVFEGCDPESRVIGRVAKDAPLAIRSSIGNAPTCYSVTIDVDGKQEKGYVMSREIDAVAAFEAARAEYALTFHPVAPAAPPAAPAASAAPAADPEPASKTPAPNAQTAPAAPAAGKKAQPKTDPMQKLKVAM